MNWLNPINWVRAGIAAKCDAEVDAKLSKEFLMERGRLGVNYLVELSKSKVDDEKLRAICADLTYCGNSLIELGNAISPDGEDGRSFSPNEIAALNARLQVLFGDVITDEQMANWRTALKAFIREKLGL